MIRRARRAVLVVAVAALALAACGVPTDGSPHAVSNDDLPDSLRPGQATTTTSVEVQQEIVSIYLIRGNKLVRALDTVAEPAELLAVLDLLQRGPTEAQAQAGDRSALTGLDLIRQVGTSGSTVTIDLDPAFVDTPSTDQILALAQLVLTATARPGLVSVRLTVNGQPTQVPRGDGTLTTKLLTRPDYLALVAPVTAST